jgi:hypothetical protein
MARRVASVGAVNLNPNCAILVVDCRHSVGKTSFRLSGRFLAKLSASDILVMSDRSNFLGASSFSSLGRL